MSSSSSSHLSVQNPIFHQFLKRNLYFRRDPSSTSVSRISGLSEPPPTLPTVEQQLLDVAQSLENLTIPSPASSPPPMQRWGSNASSRPSSLDSVSEHGRSSQEPIRSSHPTAWGTIREEILAGKEAKDAGKGGERDEGYNGKKGGAVASGGVVEEKGSLGSGGDCGGNGSGESTGKNGFWRTRRSVSTEERIK